MDLIKTEEFNKLCSLTKKEEKQVIDLLTDYAMDFLNENYDMDMICPIQLTNKFKNNKIGTFASTYWLPLYINLNKYFVAANYHRNTLDIVYPFLKHELIHYALFMKNEDNADGSPLFEHELLKYHAPSSATTKENKLSVNVVTYDYPVDIYVGKVDGKTVGTIEHEHTLNDALCKYYYKFRGYSKVSFSRIGGTFNTGTL